MKRIELLATVAVLLAVSAASADAKPPPPPERPCYGAASRDSQARCADGSLRRVVFPSPVDALLYPPSACGQMREIDLVHPCRFGAGAARPRDEVALVGDSHAGHWRATVDHVAKQRGWNGTSITRTGCPFSTARRDLPEPERSRCRAWNRQVVRWFRRHPEVHTVFVSSIARYGVRVPRGRSALAARVAGHTAAWRSLPKTVSRIIVLRDVTLRPLRTVDCVERAMKAKRPAGPACAVPRRKVLPRDGQAVAAARWRGRRVGLADMTRYMCSPRLCFPVVGGALVNKDSNHMTTAFATTLGPYLLRRVAQLGPYRDEQPADAPADPAS